MKLKLMLLATIFAAACSQTTTPNSNAPSADAAATAKAMAEIEATLKNQPHYTAKDGLEYGYTKGLSEDALKSGQAAAEILMFRYKGERNGRMQVTHQSGQIITAIECAEPCTVLKMMTFADIDYARNNVKVDRIQYAPGSIAHAVMNDALNHRLEPSFTYQGKKAMQEWVEEGRGYKYYPAER